MGHSQGIRIDRAIDLVWKSAPRLAIAIAALVLFQGAIPIATLYVMKLIVDQLTAIGASNSGAIGPGIEQFVVFAATLALVGNACNAALGHLNTVQAHQVGDYILGLVQKKSIDLDLSFFENASQYDQLHRALREAQVRPLRIVGALSQVARNSITLLCALVLLWSFHWSIAFAIFFTVLPVVFFRLRYAEDSYRLDSARTTDERMSRYINQILTTLDNAKEVRVFGFGPKLSERFAHIRKALGLSTFALSKQGQFRQFVTESVATAVAFGSLAVMVWSAVRGRVSIGDLIMYFGAFQVAIGSLRPTLSGLADIYESNLFLSTLFAFLALNREVDDPIQPKRIPENWEQGLVLSNVRFRYPGTSHDVLESVSLTIGPGEVVALVGRNGSGKTSLTKLICRLYDPDRGQVLIEGVDAKAFLLSELRSNISIIFQDFGRYHLSVRENIALGSPDADLTAAPVEEAAKWAGIHDEIMGLPNGYDTPLSRVLAHGTEFSLGQWQKIALARAYLRKSKLIILDEPTSSMDAASEALFFERFKQMIAGRSALIISHRFSTVALADRVLVLDQGKIVESGSHSDLLAKGGLYSHLYQLQASFYEPTDNSQHTG